MSALRPLIPVIGILLLLLPTASAEAQFSFVRGDANNDGLIDPIGDAVYVLGFIFNSGPAPVCLDSGDMNDDGGIDISDPVYILGWGFSSGPIPPVPFPLCGDDPTADGLDCVGPTAGCGPLDPSPTITSTAPTTATELSPYSYDVEAEDDPGDTLTFSLTTAPAGATIDPSTGLIQWTPQPDQTGLQGFTVRVEDQDTNFDEQSWQVDVADIDNAPVFTSTPVTSATEAQPYSYDADATDADGDVVSYSLTVAPVGATIDPGTGVISWTPSAAQAETGVVSFTVRALAGALDAFQSFNVTITNVNQAPTITSSPNLGATEETPYFYDVQATDPDPADTLTYALTSAPAGATIDPVTGLVSWTPPAGSAPGSFTVEVSDDGTPVATDVQSWAVNVTVDNDPPEITSTAPATATEASPYTYDVQATDPDPADIPLLVFSLVSAPAGATIDPSTGLIEWTPSATQTGAQAFTVRVEDPGFLSDDQSFVVTVADVNQAPTITSSAPPTGTELVLYQYDVDATDPDPGDTVTYSLDLAPAGATIDAMSGIIQWTPDPSQSATPQDFVVRATDDGVGPESTTQSFSVTVTDLNQAPTITSTAVTTALEASVYTYDVDATDPDPADTLTFSLVTAPTGMTIDPATGLVEWTPSATQTGANAVTVRVEDDDTAGDEQSFTVDVTDVNQQPAITSTAITVATELVAYTYDVDAVDPDPTDSVSYSLDLAPAGATINPATGVIDWTPQPDQSAAPLDFTVRATDGGGLFDTQSFAVDVTDVNNAPTITSTAVTTADEASVYTYDVDASDVDPGDLLTFSLFTAPVGATIDPATGVVNWTPSATQVGPNDFTVEVTDDGSPALSDQQSFTVTVNDVNQAPFFTSTPITLATELIPYTYDADAADNDPSDTLTYSLTVAPSGATIDPSSGQILWVPTSSQTGAQDFTVTATDDGAPTQSVDQSFVVNVTDINQQPVIVSTPVLTGNVGSPYVYDVNGGDADPGDTLTYSLLLAPAGATIDPFTGIINWTPTGPQQGPNAFTAEVMDDGSPMQSNQQSWTVDVAPSTGEATVSITAGGTIEATTFGSGSFVVANTSPTGEQITRVFVDLSTIVIPDFVFDPVGNAGDVGAQCFVVGSGGAAVGVTTPADPCVDPFSLPHDNGFDGLEVLFTDFQPGESISFGVDVDPSSIQGAPVTGGPGASSGFELSGATVTVEFDDGSVVSGQVWKEPTSLGGSLNTIKAGSPAAPTIEMLGVTAPALLGLAAQTIRVTGIEGDTVELVRSEGILDLSNVPGGGFDIEPYERNQVIGIEVLGGVIPAGGILDISVTLTRANASIGGLNTFAAVVVDGDGRTGTVSNAIVVEYDPSAVNLPPVFDTTPPTVAIADQLLSYDANATDPNGGDVLTYSLNVAPAGATIDPATGLIEWTPTVGQAGANAFEILVEDDGTPIESNTQIFSVDVLVGNQPPVITSTPGTSATTDEPYTYQVTADDLNLGDILTYSLTTAPAGATIDPVTGLVEWTPVDGQQGLNAFTVEVTDDGTPAQTDTQSFDVDAQDMVVITALHRVDCGGPGLTDYLGNVWSPDFGFNVGATFSTTSAISGVQDPIAGTTNEAIYQTERWDAAAAPELTYELPAPAGTYLVRLHFANIFAGTSAPGQRVFDIQIEGATVQSGYDIAASVGHLAADVLEFVAVVADTGVTITLIHGVENPKISGIEVLSTGGAVAILGASPGSVDFGNIDITTAPTAAQTITLTNVGSSSVTVNSITSSNGTVFPLTAPATPLTLPNNGDTTTIDVAFDPQVVGVESDQVVIDHTGINSPTVVDLSGSSFDPGAAPITFNSGLLAGESSSNPTSLGWGPDDRLYVAQQNGTIYAYDVVRNGPGDYAVTATETILDVKNIPNHNDDGSPNSNTNRQVTGLLAVPHATLNGSGQPVTVPRLYVSSSDPRIAVGNDSGVDTNSGVISRLTQDPDTLAWDHVQIVRGLPRSGENHSTNGLDIDLANNVLYIAQGGSTNKGAPGNNFAGLSEYALSAAMLSVDLDQIETLSILTDGAGQVYVYDIPTLDNPTDGPGGDPTDPFGGSDGLNQARWIAGGPVQVFSPGYRNAYDVVFTQSGRVYTYDNGPNGGWGGIPINEGPPVGGVSNVLNEFNEGNSSGFGDQLHLAGQVNVGTGAIEFVNYGGHATPVRANLGSGLYVYNKISGSWVQTDADPGTPGDQPYDWLADFPAPPVDPSLINPIEGDFLDPSVDGSLAVVGASTNGIDEYTASNFGGAMQGQLVVASFNGNVIRYALNATGDAVNDSANVGNNGTPLDVQALGDFGPFPGTIWTANHGPDTITVYEPIDYSGTPPPCSGADDPALDEDGDGFSNADEILNGTDPCSNGSFPSDADGDFVSDLLDDDDDNDGILDVDDAFAIDDQNGLGTPLPIAYNMSIDSGNQIPGTFFQLGWTGLMLDPSGATDYLTQFDPAQINAGGATSVFGIELVPDGDAYQGVNDQLYGFQFGIDVDSSTPPFRAETTLESPFFNTDPPSPPENFQSFGFFIGNGDQDNYLKVVFDGADEAVEVLLEIGGATSSQNIAVPGMLAVGEVVLSVVVDPSAGTAQAEYSLDGGATRVNAGTPVSIPASWLDPIDAIGLAVGIISTSTGPGAPFDASWDNVLIDYLNPIGDGAQATLQVTPGGGIGASTFGASSLVLTNDSTNGQSISSISIDLSGSFLPDIVWDPLGVAGDTTAKCLEADNGTGTTVGYIVPADNCVDPFAVPHDGGYDVLTVNFNDFGPGETFEFSVDIDPTTIQTQVGAGGAGSVSGLELSGSPVTITFSDGAVVTNEIYREPASDGGGLTVLKPGLPAGLSISMTGLSSPSITNTAAQTVEITGGTPNADVALLVVEGELASSVTPFDLDPYEANTAIAIDEIIVMLDGSGSATVPVTLTRTGNADSGLNHFITVELDGAGDTGRTSNVLVIEYDPAYVPSSVLYRVNCGGAAIVATDAPNPDWSQDQAASGAGGTAGNGTPSPYWIAGQDNTFGTAAIPTLAGSVPSAVPVGLFQTERWDDPAAPEMLWGFPVTSGNTYEVRLYFAEMWSGAQSPGVRVFDVLIEGALALDDLDQFVEEGYQIGFMRSFLVTPTDAELNIELLHQVQNPAIKGIEILGQ